MTMKPGAVTVALAMVLAMIIMRMSSLDLDASAGEFSRENAYFYTYGVGPRGWWATLVVLLFISILLLRRSVSASNAPSPSISESDSSTLRDLSFSNGVGFSDSDIISAADLKSLISRLDDEGLYQNGTWQTVIDKRNNRLSYTAKCCKPMEGPLEYHSTTVFENVSSKLLVDFYMDNHYRKQWDKTFVEHKQLHLDEATGIEIGQTIKKFPLLTPREYVLAWRLWEGTDQTFYCFIKECDHPLAPRQKRYVRVGFFRSGWRIRKVHGRNACEITMLHQEDTGMNIEMAKLAFSRGIWSYMCKMDDALQRYSLSNHHLLSPAVTAVSLIQKVPPDLDAWNRVPAQGSPPLTVVHGQVSSDLGERTTSGRPSRKMLASSLLVLGGAIFISRAHSSLGAKVAMAYILTKLSKRGAMSEETKKN